MEALTGGCMKHLVTPLSEEDINGLEVGDIISIDGYIYTGRGCCTP